LKSWIAFRCVLWFTNEQDLLWPWSWWPGFGSRQERESCVCHDDHTGSGTLPITDSMNKPTKCFIEVEWRENKADDIHLMFWSWKRMESELCAHCIVHSGTLVYRKFHLLCKDCKRIESSLSFLGNIAANLPKWKYYCQSTKVYGVTAQYISSSYEQFMPPHQSDQSVERNTSWNRQYY
jgi:hypothetical protein